MDAELHRKKGELLLSVDRARAEQEFCQALETARDQSAKLLELRAATSLARLWSAMGRCEAAKELLRPLYDWFGRGVDIPDMREAGSLLVELDSTPPPA